MSDKLGVLRNFRTLGASFVAFWSGSIFLADSWLGHVQKISELTAENHRLKLELERFKLEEADLKIRLYHESCGKKINNKKQNKIKQSKTQPHFPTILVPKLELDLDLSRAT